MGVGHDIPINSLTELILVEAFDPESESTLDIIVIETRCLRVIIRLTS
jgi:hypothetical protein